MPRVVPSQVIAVIDVLYKHAAAGNDMHRGTISFHDQDMAHLASILALTEAIPPELITLDPADFASLVCCMSAIRQALSQWAARGGTKIKLKAPFSEVDVVTAIRRLVALCPDSHVSTDTPGLEFLGDGLYQRELRVDLRDSFRAFSNGEWKAATVLAGSVVEALLLWCMQHKTGLEGEASRGQLAASGDFETWSLRQLAEEARRRKAISESALTLVLLAKDFRNLIHPGRTLRLGIVCDRGTALTALAAAEVVVRELEARPAPVGGLPENG